MIDKLQKLNGDFDSAVFNDILKTIEKQSLGVIYLNEIPTEDSRIPSGKLVVADDGTTKNIYFKTSQGNVLSLADADTSFWEESGGDVQLKSADDIDFQQMQAKQMRIENRTSDPSSPSTGEIWFRTDL